MGINETWEKDGYIMKLAVKEDAEKYYEQNYNPLDEEVAKMTGTRKIYTKEEVVDFFHRSLLDSNRKMFLISDKHGNIVGESVIMDIDTSLRSAHIRLGIFKSEQRGKGIGTWIVERTRDYAFEVLKLHRIELEVFSFNKTAQKVYLKTGFKVEGVLRDNILFEGGYADTILMSMLENEWKVLKLEK